MEIAVSGMGLVTCLGNTLDSVWEHLMKNASGIREITIFDTHEARSGLGGQVPGDYSLDGYNRMLEFAKESMVGAITDTGLSIEYINHHKSIVIIGTSLGHLFQNEDGAVELDNYIAPLLADIGLTVPYLSVSTACSSGSDAIALGADLIEFNQYELAICGGVDVLDIYKVMGHSSLQTLSCTQCRPFSDVDYGTTLGEGAGFVVLRRPNCMHDEERSYAWLVGRSNTTDTVSVTNPDDTGYGAVRVIEQAIHQSRFSLSQVAYINAHGSGTEANDRMELNVYRTLFSGTSPCISSTKGAFGHTLGATGAIEAIVSIYAIFKKEAPPTVGCYQVSKEWADTGLVVNKPRALGKEPLVSISVTYGFGGANACLIFADHASAS